MPHRHRSLAATATSAVFAILLVAPSLAAQRQPAPQRTVTAADVPSDLRPLLTPRHSEMQLVIQRYRFDHNLLISDFAGGTGERRGGRGRGRGPAASAPDSTVVISPRRIARLKRFDLSWQQALAQLDAAKLSPAARHDLAELRDSIASDMHTLDAQTQQLADLLPLLPFAHTLDSLIEARIAIQDMDAEAAAGDLTTVVQQIGTVQQELAGGTRTASRAQALYAAHAVDEFRSGLAYWNAFYDGYDPLYTWWMGVPYKHADSSLTAYAEFLRSQIAPASKAAGAAAALSIAPAAAPPQSGVPDLAQIIALPQDEMTGILERFLSEQRGQGRGREITPVSHDSAYYHAWLAALQSLDFDGMTRNAQVDYLYIRYRAQLGLGRVGHPLPTDNPRKTDNSGIPGPAVGREALVRELQDQLIPYTPEQLIVLGNREFAWTVNEMKKASREMGYGDDWKRALEATKTMHVPPGGQKAMIRGLLSDAVNYIRANDMVTIPQVDLESQHMVMMTPEQQLTAPFFLGGTQMLVAYPTNTMEYDARQQAMRGNNEPWSHATAFHEMIPGHNLQYYNSSVYAGYRPSMNGGPFFTEGWAVYWELTLYEKGFDDTPEKRLGALFWRLHRCARIIFSLNFHMGNWSPQQAIDFLVDSVGHERDNATAEVRRSFDPSAGYGALYQAGYLLGALQLRSMQKDLVFSGEMSQKDFNDEILRQGSMPIGLLRLALDKQKLTRDMPIAWAFYGDLPQR